MTDYKEGTVVSIGSSIKEVAALVAGNDKLASLEPCEFGVGDRVGYFTHGALPVPSGEVDRDGVAITYHAVEYPMVAVVIEAEDVEARRTLPERERRGFIQAQGSGSGAGASAIVLDDSGD